MEQRSKRPILKEGRVFHQSWRGDSSQSHQSFTTIASYICPENQPRWEMGPKTPVL